MTGMETPGTHFFFVLVLCFIGSVDSDVGCCGGKKKFQKSNLVPCDGQADSLTSTQPLLDLSRWIFCTNQNCSSVSFLCFHVCFASIDKCTLYVFRKLRHCKTDSSHIKNKKNETNGSSNESSHPLVHLYLQTHAQKKNYAKQRLVQNLSTR